MTRPPIHKTAAISAPCGLAALPAPSFDSVGLAALLIVGVPVELLSWPPRPIDGALGAVELPDLANPSVEDPVEVLVGDAIVVCAAVPLFVPEAAPVELDPALESDVEDSVRCAKPFTISGNLYIYRHSYSPTRFWSLSKTL